MPGATITYRPAVKADARRIAELNSIASDGIADYIWSKIAEPGDTLLDVGQQRYERKNTNVSYQNCIVADCDGTVAAILLSFEIPKDSDYVEEDPVLKPFWLLEEPRSLYVAALAVDENYRRMGIARTLMQMAEDKCREMKLSKLSLIVFEENTVAYEFYRRLGYLEVMRKPIVPHSLIHCAGDALLLVKRL